MKDEIWKTITSRRNCAKAKNVVVFIGDGMGIPVITAARILKGQKAGKTGEETFLNFERFPYTGLMRTYCTDKQVPDSACTGTALFGGIKAPYYTLGVDVHAKFGDCKATMKYKSYFPESIMTHAQAAKKLTGFVTTSRVTHATPAATYAHSPHRDWECDGKLPPEATECKDIARQMIEDAPARDFHVMMGGGRQFFFPNETYNQNRSEAQCQRRDGRKLVETWINDKKSRNATYKYVTTTSELQDAMRNKPDYLLGLFSSSHMSYESERNTSPNGEPSLADMTEAAINILENDKGFLLMVEGAKIDHALHDNNARRSLEDLLALEEAVERALRKTSQLDTLIIVTADHSHTLTINGYPSRGNPILGIAEKQTDFGLPYTTLMFANGVGYNYTNNGTHILWRNLTNVDTEALDFRQQAAIYREDGDETHGGEDVAAYAIGPWAHLITGAHEQPYVAHVANYAACLGDYAEMCQSSMRKASCGIEVSSANTAGGIHAVFIIIAFSMSYSMLHF
ncbi:unnamed protein product [Notodromas monacha]|uniref:Alkaline phosphatase n=1 Tax=Notodromas monacha TaxID=399045 RepID=A0A7R9GFV1_9CRUS|nr:unnamed protein product [Notodromas monacha]CAG0919537.1 unnamed protein product [Notodromas monacha]